MTIVWPIRKNNDGGGVGPAFETTPTVMQILREVVLAANISLETPQIELDDGDHKTIRLPILDLQQSILHDLDHSTTTSYMWRQSVYRRVLQGVVELQASRNASTVVAMCRAGLHAARQAFVIEQHDDSNNNNNNNKMTVQQAVERYLQSASSPSHLQVNSNNRLDTLTLHGSRPCSDDGDGGSTVPFPWTDDGTDPCDQIQQWLDAGSMEPSAARHAMAVYGGYSNSNNDHTTTTTTKPPTATSLVSSHVFCLLGITSELGPVDTLMHIPGVHMMGVARAGPKWDALQQQFTSTAYNNSILYLPVNGADLLQDFVAIADWIVETYRINYLLPAQNGCHPPPRDLVLMPLAYMDGEANMRVTVAMDAIVTMVQARLEAIEKDSAPPPPSTPTPQPRAGLLRLVYLTSPTTVFVIPPEAAQDAQRRYQQRRWQDMAWQVATLGQCLVPVDTWKQLSHDNDDDDDDIPRSVDSAGGGPVLNALSQLQGPNYAVAKLLQQWRCIVAAYDNNNNNNSTGSKNITTAASIVVLAPHAPPTQTRSVVHNPQAAAALRGMEAFPPLFAFPVLPCNRLMTAIVLHQLHCVVESNHNIQSSLPSHPLHLFWDGSVHGGLWRCPYQVSSWSIPVYVAGSMRLGIF